MNANAFLSYLLNYHHHELGHYKDKPLELRYLQKVHFVIMGCGRVGAALALALENYGHSVAVIDQNSESFRRLPSEFEGKKVTGLGFDRETLERADITNAYAFAAVSDGDNSNVLAARVAREQYGVENVVARIYDPKRAEIFQRLGITTVATVKWTADQVIRRLLPLGASDFFIDDEGLIQLFHTTFHRSWVGQSIAEIDRRTQSRVAYISRFGQTMLVKPQTLLQAEDNVFLLVESQNTENVERTLNNPLKVES